MALRAPRTSRHAQRAVADTGAPKLSLRNLPVRAKVALVLLAPLVLGAVLTGINVLASKAAYDNATRNATQVSIIRPAARYQSAVERASVLSRQVNEFSEPAFRAQIGNVKTAGAELRAALDATPLSPEVAAIVRHTLDATAKASAGEGFESLANAQRMADLVADDVSKLTNAISRQLDRPEPRLQALDLAIQAHLALSKQQMIIGSTGVIPEDSSELFGQFGAEHLALTRMIDQTGLDATLLFLLNANEQRVQTAGTGIAPSITTRSIAPYDVLIPSLVKDLETTFTSNAATALRAALLILLVSGLSFVVAIGLAFLVARQIVAGIAKVRDDTLKVANELLPQTIARIRSGEEPGEIVAVGVATTEETGQVARAVDSLHRQAVNLAAQEAEVRARVADMFTTLSRRNTSLVNQQLGVIETLEQDEQDPERLEQLFRLDHLAARMRRNAQSLVILADAPVRTASVESMSVNEAVMAALGGVQDYRRVSFEPSAPQLLQGSVSPDVVHLLTELLDNALAFSPPTAQVLVTTQTTPESVLIRIKDGGLGLKEDDLARLRASLRTPGEASAETARRMGLFVVSRLAHRHDVDVALDPNEWGGVTATVTLPAALYAATLPPAPDLPATAVPAPALPLVDLPAPASVLPATDAPPSVLPPVLPPVAVPAPVLPPVAVPAPVLPPVAVPAPVLETSAESVRANTPEPATPALALTDSAVTQPAPLVAATPSAATAEAVAAPTRVGHPVHPLTESAPVGSVRDRVGQDLPPLPARRPGAQLVAQDAPGPGVPSDPVPGGPDGVAHLTRVVTDAPAVTEGVSLLTRTVTEAPAVIEGVSLLTRTVTEAPAAGGVPRVSPALTQAPAAPDRAPVDELWSRRASKPQPPAHTPSGLPIRQPGTRAVPGGSLGSDQARVIRDPEALRQRLSAHAAGVSLGRQATLAKPVRDTTTQEA